MYAARAAKETEAMPPTSQSHFEKSSATYVRTAFIFFDSCRVRPPSAWRESTPQTEGRPAGSYSGCPDEGIVRDQAFPGKRHLDQLANDATDEVQKRTRAAARVRPVANRVLTRSRR